MDCTTDSCYENRSALFFGILEKNTSQIEAWATGSLFSQG
jgi:hypothetical protein